MKIACLSGKGGAGKTFIAVNLAASIKTDTYIDCDVEEPNGKLFFTSQNISTEKDITSQNIESIEVTSLLPDFDETKCTGCKECVHHCAFHALIYIKDKPLVFPEVCHSCGLCLLVCPEKAITEKPKSIGKLEIASCKKTKVVTGILNPGEASGVPVIKSALKQSYGTTIIDCPPGSACSVMESVEEADFCILVAEPTVFGFHNFKMVHQLVKLLKKPCGVIINKEDETFEELNNYCKENSLPIFAKIPYKAEYAKLISEGKILCEEFPEINSLFCQLKKDIEAAL